MSPKRKRRSVQEEKAAGVFDHADIVTILDNSAGNGTDFIAMEFVPFQRAMRGRASGPAERQSQARSSISRASGPGRAASGIAPSSD